MSLAIGVDLGAEYLEIAPLNSAMTRGFWAQLDMALSQSSIFGRRGGASLRSYVSSF